MQAVPGRTPGHFLNPAPPTGPPPPRRISYHGSCPQGLADSAWIPFREHCYSFHMELLLGHKEALQRCQRGGPVQARAPTGRFRWRLLSRALRGSGNSVPVLRSARRRHLHRSAPSVSNTRSPRIALHVGDPGHPHTEAHSTPSSTWATGEEGWSLSGGVGLLPQGILSVLM